MRKSNPVFILPLISLLVSGCILFGVHYRLELRVQDSAGGTLSSSPSGEIHAENTEIVITASPQDGWELSEWQGAIKTGALTAKVVMDADRAVTAVFQPKLKKNNLVDGSISEPSVNFSPSDGSSWLFMIYLDADNNLSDVGSLDLQEIEFGVKAAANESLKVLVLYDGLGDGVGSGSPDAGTRLYLVDGSGKSEVSSERLGINTDEAAELNMGSPLTLKNFINTAAEKYPSDHYSLILWNHGGGAKSFSVPKEAGVRSRHICQDENTGAGTGDILYNNELQTAIAGSDLAGELDVIAMDACLMGTVETAYEFRNLAGYFVGSMSNVNRNGWNYNDFFSLMTVSAGGAGSSDALELSRHMVDSFYRQYRLYSGESISAVRCSKLENLKLKIDSLAVRLYGAEKKVVIERIRDNSVNFYNDYYVEEMLACPYIDLSDFCSILIQNENYLSADISAAASGVADALSDAVVLSFAGSSLGNYYGSGSQVKRGLSIFFSSGNLLYKGLSHYARQGWYTSCPVSGKSYGEIDFCSSDTDGKVESWREMMEAWYDPYKTGGYTVGSW